MKKSEAVLQIIGGALMAGITCTLLFVKTFGQFQLWVIAMLVSLVLAITLPKRISRNKY